MPTNGRRRIWWWWFAGYLMLLGLVVWSLFSARHWARTQLATPSSTAAWEQWREDVRADQDRPAPVQRRVPKSAEPPALVLTRDIVPEQEGLFALKVRGTSMIDAMVDDGDIVVMKKQSEAKNGDMVAARLIDRDEMTLKYFYLEPNRVRLQPANPTLGPIYTHPANLEIQGRVVAVIRRVH
jgi:hypothetical protein